MIKSNQNTLLAKDRNCTNGTAITISCTLPEGFLPVGKWYNEVKIYMVLTNGK